MLIQYVEQKQIYTADHHSLHLFMVQEHRYIKNIEPVKQVR